MVTLPTLTFKTKMVTLVGSKLHGDVQTPLNILCGEEQIQEVSSYKYLGVMVDKHITFEAHAEYISGKVSKRLSSLSRAWNTLPQELRKLVEKSKNVFRNAVIEW